MEKIRFLLAVWACKVLISVSKILNKKGTTTPAVPAFKICPNILSIISSKVKKDIIVVCGTNGKTTTNNIICNMLESKGYSVACNKVGANMLYGVIVSFIEKANIFGKVDIDYACIEVDEASAQKVFKYFSPDYVVLTNLFRDQLDRYGEIDLTVKYIETAINMSNKTTLIVNADDPLCQSIAKRYNKKYITYGIDERIGMKNVMNEIKDSQFCPICGNKLSYNHYYYGQLGDYYCSNCNFKRPALQYTATDVSASENIKFKFNHNQDIIANYGGLYNVYNILAALAALKSINADTEDINKVLSGNDLPIGRMEKFYIGKDVILNLSKNPIGFTQAISTMLDDDRTKDVIVMINDNAQDGRDISWLWDVDFEKIENNKVNALGITGKRKEDLAVRFKYAQVNKGNVVYKDIEQAVKKMLESKSEVLYVLVNYTAIFTSQEIIKKMEDDFKENKNI